jgi:hypothetical protein
MSEELEPKKADTAFSEPGQQLGTSNPHLVQNNFYFQPSVISEAASIQDSAPELYEAYVDGFKMWNATWSEDTRETRKLSYQFLRVGQNKAVFVTLVVFGISGALGFAGDTSVAIATTAAGTLFGIGNLVRAFTGKSTASQAPDDPS